MSNFDNKHIYVPESVETVLFRDAVLFEVYKSNGRTINKNHFLNLLIYGYYNTYSEECRVDLENLAAVISDSVPELDAASQALLAERINRTVVLPGLPKRGRTAYKRISFKPTAMTESIINSIMSEPGGGDSLSQYFCRMFTSYCEKPLFERERIIFSENYNLLKKMCAKHSPVTFSLIWEKDKVYNVIPYEIVTGYEEMMNYLLCQLNDNDTVEHKAAVFRLNRIKGLCPSRSSYTLSDDITARLKRMKKYGPQYVINSEEEICVRLTNGGDVLYSRIYYGRPVYDRIEHRDDGHYYFFRCSEDQVFLYFRRFDNDTAEIISPYHLRQRMIDFHSGALKAYTDNK